MNKYARFDEIPLMTLKDIKETKRYGRTDGRTDGQRKKQYTHPQTQFAGGIDMMGRSPQCYIPSLVEISRLVPEKKNFEGFLLYMGMVAILVI